MHGAFSTLAARIPQQESPLDVPKDSTFVQTATKQDTRWWSAEGLQRVMELDKTKPRRHFGARW